MNITPGHGRNNHKLPNSTAQLPFSTVLETFQLFLIIQYKKEKTPNIVTDLEEIENFFYICVFQRSVQKISTLLPI